MRSRAVNNNLEQQSSLSWAEEAFGTLAQRNTTDLSVAAAMEQSTLASLNDMTYRQPQPSGAASVETLAFTAWLLSDDSTPFDWQQFGPGYSQSNDYLLDELASQSAYTPNAWPILKSEPTPFAFNTVPSSVAATQNSSPKSPDSNGVDHYYTPGSVATPAQASPYTPGLMATPVHTSPSTNPPNTVLPSADEDRYLAAAGLAALPLKGDKAPPSGTQGDNAGEFQWYGVEPVQPLSAGDDMQHGSAQASYNSVEIQPPVTRAPLTKEERDYNDKILIEGKARGETYKEIRAKLIGECPAESTLRGRYRVLTKALNDRVRRPVWTKTDIILLTKFVNDEFQRINAQVQHADTLSMRQKLSRVSWKKVADNIKVNGGSYHFGVTTCKKKWIELNIPSSAPTAPTGADANSATLNERYD